MAELQQPDIVGNYLSRYTEAQQRQQAMADRQRMMQRQDRQDQMAEQQFAGNMDAQKLEMALKRGSAMANIIGSVRDGDAQGFEAAKMRAQQELGISPEQMAHLTIKDLPRLRTESGLALKELQEQALRANIRQSNAAADASMAAAEATRRRPVGNIDPNTNARVAPLGIQNRDAADLQATRKTADAAANIVALLRSSKRAFEAAPTGDSFGAQRTVAGVLNAIPGYTWAERELAGSTHTRDIINSYDEISNVAIKQGIEELQKVGGSDTNLELLTAIRTAPNPDVRPEENRRRIENISKAAEILSQKADLQTKWVNKAGSLGYALTDQQGNQLTWPKFWSRYQQAAWDEHLKRTQSPGPAGGNRDYRGEQRQLMQGQGSPSVPPPPPGFEVR